MLQKTDNRRSNMSDIKVTKQNHVDATLIKVFLNQENYEKYATQIKTKVLARETQLILKELKSIYKKNPELKNIDCDTLKTLFRTSFPNLGEKQREVYSRIFDQVDKLPTVQASVVMKKMNEDFTWDRLETLKNSQGLDLEKIDSILSEHRSFLPNVKLIEEATEWDMEDLFEEEDLDGDLKWRLAFMNKNVGSPSHPKFHVWAGYVNTGKTGMAVSEACYIAGQLTGEDRVLWLNNEESDSDVRRKFMACVCNESTTWIKENKKEAIQTYMEHMNGDKNRIVLLNTTELEFTEIRDYILSHKFRLIVCDTIDKLNSSHIKVYNKEHERLSNLYNNVRKLAYDADCTIIGVSQTDASTISVDKDTGEEIYVRYPILTALAGSKVGKQGEADVIITIGQDKALPKSRFLHVAKMKGRGNGQKTEVRFNPNEFKYLDTFE